jgi:hypothetical protein
MSCPYAEENSFGHLCSSFAKMNLCFWFFFCVDSLTSVSGSLSSFGNKIWWMVVDLICSVLFSFVDLFKLLGHRARKYISPCILHATLMHCRLIDT